MNPKRQILINDPELLGLSINILKESLSQQLSQIFNNTIAYGPFSGFKMAPSEWSQSMDRGVMLLGIYEQEVLAVITTNAPSFDYFVNIGSADGYYALGVLKNNHFKKSYCFEILEKEREVFLNNAELNNLNNRFEMYEQATSDFHLMIPDDVKSNCIMLVDIEGFEFEIFNRESISAFRKALIVIELHEFAVEDGESKLENLLNIASEFFDLEYLTTAARDVSVFPELRRLQDNLRWLLVSEGRAQLQRWLVLKPK
jgi:hypothetical protein